MYAIRSYYASLLQTQNGWQQGYVGLGWMLSAVCIFFLLANAPARHTHEQTPFFKDAGRLFTGSNFLERTYGLSISDQGMDPQPRIESKIAAAATPEPKNVV